MNLDLHSVDAPKLSITGTRDYEVITFTAISAGVLYGLILSPCTFCPNLIIVADF